MIKSNNPTLSVLIVFALFFLFDAAVFHVLKGGMDRYHGLDKPAKILCVGHSHTVLGIDAVRMETELGVPVSKYALAGANTLDRYWMIRQFVERQPSVQVVVYDVDPRLFDTEGLSSASYSLFFPYVSEPAIDRYLRKEATWQEYVPARLVRTARFRDQTLNIALRGLLGKIENKKSTRMRPEAVAGFLAREKEHKIRVNPEARQIFLDTVDYLTQKGITVVLAFIPVVDLLNQVDPAGQAAVVGFFEDLAAGNDNVVLFDYNRDYQHRHELFYDLRHLNGEGNEIVTGRLIKDLKVLWKK